MCLRTFRKYTQPTFMFQVNNETFEQGDANGVFLVSFLLTFEHISDLVLVFLFLTLSW